MQIVAVTVGAIVVLAILYTVLRRPRHKEGDHDAWASGDDAGCGSD